MVEMAIVCVLFLSLIFASIEFSIALLRWGQAIEATRSGVRCAIVNDPVDQNLFTIPTLSCPGGPPLVANCAGTSTNQNSIIDCARLLPHMQRSLHGLESANVEVTYACSDAGYVDRPSPLPLVTVAVVGLSHNLILPGLLGLNLTWTIPKYATTRLAEDLHTVTSDPQPQANGCITS